MATAAEIIQAQRIVFAIRHGRSIRTDPRSTVGRLVNRALQRQIDLQASLRAQREFERKTEEKRLQQSIPRKPITPKPKPILQSFPKPKPKPTLTEIALKRSLPASIRNLSVAEVRRRQTIKPVLQSFPKRKPTRTQRISALVRKEVGLGFFENKASQEEQRINNQINRFAQERQNFYQRKVNSGSISVIEANNRIIEDINKRSNKLQEESEFFKSGETGRKVTTNPVSFLYETRRLEALKKGDQKTADAWLLFKIVADAPTGLIKLGQESRKGLDKLFNDPQARETSIENIKNIFTPEKVLKFGLETPQKSSIAIEKGVKFAFTSPTTALAIVAGNIIGFKIITKVGKPVLKAIGILSKDTSRQIIKNLKFDPFVKAGLKDIGKISVELSPKVLTSVTKAVKVKKPLAVSTKATNKLIASVNKSIKKSRVGVKITKVSKKLSKEQLRLRKRRIAKRVKKLRVSGVIRKRITKVKTAKEKALIKKRIKKRKKEKLRRRKLLKQKQKKEALARKLKATKLARKIRKVKKIPKRLKKRIGKLPSVVKVKKVRRKLKERKVKAITKKRIIKMRKEKVIRRKILLKEEKFRRSKIGKLKLKVFAKIRDLDTALKKFESPSARLLFDKTKKTPLSRTFPRELKFKINDKAVEDFVRKQFRSEGQDFNKLSQIDKNFLTGQVKVFIRNNPKAFIPRARKKLLKRFQKTKVKKGVKKTLTIKVQGGGKITLTKIKPSPVKRLPSRPSAPSRPGRQILLQKQKLKKPKQILVRLKIKPARLGVAQKQLLKRFNKSQSKQKVLQKQVSVLRQKQLVQVRGKKKITTRQKQKLRSNSLQLQKLAIASLILSKQILKQRQNQLIKQKQNLRELQGLKQTPLVKQSQNILQSQIQAQTQGLTQGLQITKPTFATKPFVPIIFKRKKRKPSRRKATRQQAYNVLGRPLRRPGQKGKIKLIKLNKRPLTKIDAERLGSTLADNTVARTFKIKKVGGKPKRPTLKTKSFKKRKFRSFKIKKGKRVRLKNTFIETKKYLIDSHGERKGLSLRRGLAKLRKESKVKRKVRVRRFTKSKATSTQLKNLKKARAVRNKNSKRKNIKRTKTFRRKRK